MNSLPARLLADFRGELATALLRLGLSLLLAVVAAARATPAVPRLTPSPKWVQGITSCRLNLDGQWRFSPSPPPRFWARPPSGWKPIRVPGEWTIQGFTVASNVAAGYARTFHVPADWAGRRLRLRCDGIYSKAVVWINGREAGRHLGGFTPFELDVTALVRPGRNNRIAVAVKNESLADTLASGSKYAAHPLGGILRKMYLLALPTLNVASLQVATRFDSAYSNATLRVELQVANQGTLQVNDADAALALLRPDHRPVALAPSLVRLPSLAPGQVLNQVIKIPIADPEKWDPLHPNLYVLNCQLRRDGAALESVDRRFGFRQVEVRGNRMFLNGYPVKLRGVCRHEVDPLLGRSLTPALCLRDAELLARGNCNYVRTSHYPPAEEFIAACDQVGLLVEEEAPFCWAGHNNSPRARAYTLQAELEMVQRDRSHPSVIQWSLGNESNPWGTNFALAVAPIRALDPTRPLDFEVGSLNANPQPPLDIDCCHYPSPQEVRTVFAGRERPVLAGEYCHLNCYNRREQLADPGLRVIWGLGLARMWDAMRATPGCLGGSIWAGIDDTFFLPDGRTVGYGTWGVLDGWRRPKPEYWEMAKAYSPVRIRKPSATLATNGSVRLTVENRSEFANLDEFTFAWTLAGKSGRATTVAPPGGTGVLTIPTGADTAGKTLTVRVTGPRGFRVDAYRFTLGGRKQLAPPPAHRAGPLAMSQSAHTITVTGTGFQYVFDAHTGQLQGGRTDGHSLDLNGPVLTLVPLDSEGGGTQMTGHEPTFTPLWGLCTRWKASRVTAERTGRTVTLKAEGAYTQASGDYEITIDDSGRLKVSWSFALKHALNPRQTGITFILPKRCQTLSWRRRGHWSWYPPDDIGRLQGTARAFTGHPICGLAGPRTRPSWPWSQDQTQYGCNDFRSTKFNIFSAALTDNHGVGLRAVADANRDAHAWISDGHACLLVANYANDGDEGFFRPTRAIPNRPVAAGGAVDGSARVELVGARATGARRAHDLPIHDSSDGLALTPPMGWYPWNQFGDAQNEALIKQITRAMVSSGMRNAGYWFVGPDEGVCYRRGADGRLTTVRRRYPSGLRGLGDYIHARGLKFALYTDAGTRTCSKGMPGTKGHEFEDLRSFANWRCDYLKIDWCNTQGMNVTNAYRLLYRANRATGRPIVQSLCSWGVGHPWNWAAAVGNLWRTTQDVCQPGHVDWNNAIQIAFFNQKLYRSAGPGHWNDPDMLIVGMPGMTQAQNQTIFSLWCLMAAPLIAGNDLRTMTSATVAVLTNLEAIAVDQDPLGIQGHVVSETNDVSLWAGKRLYDGSQALVLYNRRLAPATVHVSWVELGLADSADCYVRDLWRHKTTGPHRSGITVTVPPADVVMLRIAKHNAFPIPPIISADTYRLAFTATGSRPQTLSGDVKIKTAGTDILPLWRVRPNLPSWLTVTVTRSGETQTLVNTISTASLTPGRYHALVRADNTEPVSGRPLSAFYYDVDLQIHAR